MHSECNGVAFGELTLSTRLKHKHENDTSKVRNRRCHQSVQLLNLSMLMISSTKRYCLHNCTLANSPSLHKPVRRLLKHEPCFGDLNSKRIVRCVKPAKDRKHHCKTASGETGRWWRQIDGHWSWCWAKQLRKGPRGQMSHQQRWWGSHTSWQTRKRKWWLIWQLGCRHARHWQTEDMQLDLDWCWCKWHKTNENDLI